MHLLFIPPIHMGFRQDMGWEMERSHIFVFQDTLRFLWFFQQVTEDMINIKIQTTLPYPCFFFSYCVCQSGLHFILSYVPGIEATRDCWRNSSFISSIVLLFLECQHLSAVHSQHCINDEDGRHRAMEWVSLTICKNFATLDNSIIFSECIYCDMLIINWFYDELQIEIF